MTQARVHLDADGTAHFIRPLYLSRARLKSSPSVATLVPLLLTEGTRHPSADHRLVWHIFAEDGPGKRPFLFRRESADGHGDGGRFLILSETPPVAETALFDIETQEFAPHLRKGDVLRFSLLANPTVAISAGNGPSRARSRIVDVVMAAIHAVEKGARGEPRRNAILAAGADWLTAQGTRNGFALIDPAETLAIDGYQKHILPRGSGGNMTYSTLEFEGSLRITDPVAFLTRLAQGFGRAKAFGCGLMLIRRG